VSESMLAAALAYASMGWPVFPVAPGGKVPAIKGGHGCNDATTDPATISEWWRRLPAANVGLACGPAGLVVVDVDPRHGGDESLAALVIKHGEGWTRTPRVTTPSGGTHLYFRGQIQSRNGMFPGIDIKSLGGYVVAPPSSRPDGRYEWVEAPEDTLLLLAPEWLAETGTPPLTGAADGALLEGGRNDGLASLAGSMRRRGMSPMAIEAALQEENRTRCSPPLPRDEVSDIVESICKYPPAPSTRLFSLNSLFSHREEQREWPTEPGPAAFHGIVGEFVERVEPHTEADPIALVANLLASFGSAVGPQPVMYVGATKHHAREFFSLVGRTSKARKGDSWPPVLSAFTVADEEWADRVASGLSTGEGLIHAVRDPSEKMEPIKEKGRAVGYQQVLVDEGVADKRLLVVEPELARVLKVMERQGNSLSPVLRQAWDAGTLKVMTRTNPLRATGAHISLVGHITAEELERSLSDVEAANGFANRWVWLAVKRSKLLADPVALGADAIAELGFVLSHRLERARGVQQLRRSPAATDLWTSVYSELSEEREGLVGALTARAEAHVMRLSMLYALTDGSAVIELEHLVAALELWAYAERSVAYVFGDATGDPLADLIYKSLRAQGEMARTEIAGLFGRHESAARIGHALQLLVSRGKATFEHRASGGRPTEIWRAVA
jgi:hypothetical protein